MQEITQELGDNDDGRTNVASDLQLGP